MKSEESETKLMLSRRRNKGLTIIELLNYLFLSTILLAVMITFLNSVLTQYVFVGERVVIKKSASLLVRSIKSDLELSRMDGITVASDTMTVQQMASLADSGEVVWNDTVVCYRYFPELKEVKRWETPVSSILYPQGDPGSLQDITPQLAQAVGDPLQEDIVRPWSHLDAFQLQKDGSHVKVTMKLGFQDSKEMLHEYSLSQPLTVFNGEEDL